MSAAQYGETVWDSTVNAVCNGGHDKSDVKNVRLLVYALAGERFAVLLTKTGVNLSNLHRSR